MDTSTGSSWGEEDSSGHVRVSKTDLALCQIHGEGGSGTPEWPLGRGQLVQASDPFNGLGAGRSVSGIAAASVATIGALATPGTARRLGAALAARGAIAGTAPESVSR